jgi:hypothetical protein
MRTVWREEIYVPGELSQQMPPTDYNGDYYYYCGV